MHARPDVSTWLEKRRVDENISEDRWHAIRKCNATREDKRSTGIYATGFRFLPDERWLRIGTNSCDRFYDEIRNAESVYVVSFLLRTDYVQSRTDCKSTFLFIGDNSQGFSGERRTSLVLLKINLQSYIC